MSQDYFCQKTLLMRGWSLKMIHELLGKPDRINTNPYNDYFPPMKLYDAKRVRRIENSWEFFGELLEKDERARRRKRVQISRSG